MKIPVSAMAGPSIALVFAAAPALPARSVTFAPRTYVCSFPLSTPNSMKVSDIVWSWPMPSNTSSLSDRSNMMAALRQRMARCTTKYGPAQPVSREEMRGAALELKEDFDLMAPHRGMANRVGIDG